MAKAYIKKSKLKNKWCLIIYNRNNDPQIYDIFPTYQDARINLNWAKEPSTAACAVYVDLVEGGASWKYYFGDQDV